jgi:hypothetical protein
MAPVEDGTSEYKDAAAAPHDGTAEPRTPPPPPIPSSDPRLIEDVPNTGLEISAQFPRTSLEVDDIFHITPIAALRLLSSGIESLVRITGDIPPTPPPTSPTIPNMRTMQAEKENIVRSQSERNLARLVEQAQAPAPSPTSPTRIAHEPIDGVQFRAAAISGMSESMYAASNATQPEPYILIGANSQPLNLQHSAITRKFYSKKPPPISITEYLLRMHRFCPMSTAVYLATSLYIHRLAVAERAIVVTARNAHRLLLAGLRVAMKALEDLSYQHAQIAKVGGVSETELARLEISFCFLCSFEFMVREEVLTSHWAELRAGRGLNLLKDQVGGIANLRIERRIKAQA